MVRRTGVHRFDRASRDRVRRSVSAERSFPRIIYLPGPSGATGRSSTRAQKGAGAAAAGAVPCTTAQRLISPLSGRLIAPVFPAIRRPAEPHMRVHPGRWRCVVLHPAAARRDPPCPPSPAREKIDCENLSQAGPVADSSRGRRNPACAGPGRRRSAGQKLKKGEHICIVGNTLAERMQHDGWLETLYHSRFPSMNW